VSIETKLTGVPETLLIPLWARAVEGKRSKPIVRDDKAGEILANIDYDFGKFEKSRLSQLGVSIRTMLLDNAVRAFLDDNSGACVVNLGAGLDTRHSRVGREDTEWYELDLPEALELRRNFFEETPHYHFLPKSMFDESWFDDVDDKDRPVLIVAEGLIMYFSENELRPFMTRLADRFRGAEMLVEVMGPALVGRSRLHDSVSKMDNAPEFKWGITDSKELTSWHSGIEFLEEWCYFDYHRDRAGLMGLIVRLPFVRKRIAPRIVHLRFRK
jgi:O-methyltransferase involved in polyketide biosynthesis